jgi:TusA-related sulfurtransferase
MNDQTVQTVEFDIRGQICPSSLLIVLREVNSRRAELRSGGLRLSFRTDNRDATNTVPMTVRNMGYSVSVTKEQGHYLIVIGRERHG